MAANRGPIDFIDPGWPRLPDPIMLEFLRAIEEPPEPVELGQHWAAFDFPAFYMPGEIPPDAQGPQEPDEGFVSGDSEASESEDEGNEAQPPNPQPNPQPQPAAQQ